VSQRNASLKKGERKKTRTTKSWIGRERSGLSAYRSPRKKRLRRAPAKSGTKTKTLRRALLSRGTADNNTPKKSATKKGRGGDSGTDGVEGAKEKFKTNSNQPSDQAWYWNSEGCRACS